MKQKKEKKVKTPWEIAKPILRKHCLDGTITDAMKPQEVFAMQPEFSEVKCENFRNNFAAMRRTIKKHKSRADDDPAGFLHDMTAHTLAKDNPECWHGSEAKRLLKKDVEKKKHEKLKPELLWMSRPECKRFDSAKFRGHVHQELRSERETLHWIVKQKKRKQLEEAIRSGKQMNEEDIDHLHDPVIEMKSVQIKTFCCECNSCMCCDCSNAFQAVESCRHQQHVRCDNTMDAVSVHSSRTSKRR